MSGSSVRGVRGGERGKNIAHRQRVRGGAATRFRWNRRLMCVEKPDETSKL